uniref:Alpha-catulin n=1 Tax=Myotis myotis TaxID=51298 RepID=A0A7J7UN72_MYOMY|nr:catenin alpha like 1 [Myotis myotis]
MAMAASPGPAGVGGAGAMPGSGPSSFGFDSGLEIKTRSVEQTLLPLVSQITTLINHKDNTKKSDKTLQAIQRVGQAVNLAVGRFVKVGEAIANENWDLKEEITIACIEAKQAGETIAALTDVSTPNRPESGGQITIFTDKTGVIKAARLLLSSVTKVLLLADRVVIKQIITSRNKVLATMERLEKVNSFQEFVQIFSQFGNEMVEFAHLTGDRQNDLKDEKKKAKMAAARAVLEKCTMMLLTASKTCLRHPNCESAHKNKEGVFDRMKVALDKVIEIVTDCKPNGETDVAAISIFTGIKEFKMNIEALRENLYFQSKENLSATLEAVLERTEDFTDSAYTSHEHRMAYSLYLFTRGEGPLKTSQDLIHQLEVFAEEGLKVASSAQAFSKQLKDDDKLMLLLEINKLIPLCHQLQTITKTPVQNQGLLKVDKCITKTRSMMAILVQLLSLCFKLLKKLQMENNRWVSVTNKDSVDGKT